MSFLALFSLIASLGLTCAGIGSEDNSTAPPISVTGSDGKPCIPGTGESNSCQPSATSTTKPSSMEISKTSTPYNNSVATKRPDVDPPSMAPCDLQHFLLKDCNSSCDSDICSDMGNYTTDMCNSQGIHCDTICTEILQKHAGKCNITSNGSATFKGPLETTSNTNSITKFVVSTSASLPLLTIVIAIVTVVVVLILTTLILAIIILALVFRYKTKHVQQRYDEAPNVERYVIKDLETLTSRDSKDSLYDTIDETATMPACQSTSFTRRSQSPLLESCNRNGTNTGSAPGMSSGIENRIYFENSALSANVTMLPYEEPVSALKNFHRSSGQGETSTLKSENSCGTDNISQHQQQQPKRTGAQDFEDETARILPLPPVAISADYAVLEEEDSTGSSTQNVGSGMISTEKTNGKQVTLLDPTTADYAVLKRPTCNPLNESPQVGNGTLPDKTGKSNTTKADYEVLERTICNPPSVQPYERLHLSSSTLQCSDNNQTNIPRRSVIQNTPIGSTDTPNSGPDYATLDPPSTDNL